MSKDEQLRVLEVCRTFVDSIADQVLVIGDDHRILMANRALLDCVGRPADQVVGKACYEVTHGLDRPCDEAGEACPLRQVLETGQSTSVTHEHLGENGKARTVHVVSSPLRDDSGTTVGTIEVLRDVTAQKELEETLRLRNEQLERLHQDRERFTSTVSHEVRNALNVVNLNAQALSGEDPSPTTRRHTEAIMRHSRRLGSLIEDLRDASAIATQRFSIRKRPCDLVEVVEQAVDAHRLPGSAHEIRIRGRSKSIHGTWDPDRLAQVVDNLLSNAVKYSPSGGTIEVEITRKKTHVWVCVTDEGIGIPPNRLERVFQPYARAHTGFTGTGLGLFLSRGIVHAHEGEMMISSTEGEGTSVRFWLPRDRGPDSDRP